VPPSLASLHVDVEGGAVLFVMSRLDSATAQVARLSVDDARRLAASLRAAADLVEEAGR
jgi:hypothetical protein